MRIEPGSMSRALAPALLAAMGLLGGALAQTKTETGPETWPVAFIPEPEVAAPPGLADLLAQHAVPLALLLAALLVWLYGRRAAGEHPGGLRRLAALIVLIAFLAEGVILAQQRDDGSTTRTRTRNGQCILEGEFALRVMPANAQGTGRDVLFVQISPGLEMSGNRHLLMKVKDIRVAPLPGTITFRFRRGPAGDQAFSTITRQLENPEDLRNLLSAPPVGVQPPRMNSPANLRRDNTPVTERLRAEVQYDPRNITDDCKPIRSDLTIRWTFPRNNRDFSLQPMGSLASTIKVPKHRSRVRTGDGIIDETTGIPNEVNKAVFTQVYFAVDDPFRCCGRADRDYTIVQFVRHRWKLGPGPERSDTWNLDGSESQSQRHAQGQDYDPTYTTDPAHGGSTADEDNQLVHVGPWDASGGSAITVDDYPGLLEADHNRFLQAGGYFEHEFVTLLVCKEDRGTAAHYLANGRVRAKTRFKIRRTYPGNNQPATVAGSLVTGAPEGGPEFYPTCLNLADVLRQSGLIRPFNNPRSHRLRLQ